MTEHRHPSFDLPENSVLSLSKYLAMQRSIAEGESSAKELSETPEIPSNRLHYHLDKLESVELIANRKRKERGSDAVFVLRRDGAQ